MLDDNKKLCLMSGEIIQMSDQMNLLFEPMDLEVASPATVSRCGMIYMEPHMLGWRPLLQSWLTTLPPTLTAAQRSDITDRFERMVPPLLEMMGHKGYHHLAHAGEINLVKSCMSMYESLMDEFVDAKKVAELGPGQADAWLEGCFLMSLIWSLGGTSDSNGRKKFDLILRTMIKGGIDDATMLVRKPFRMLEHDFDFVFSFLSLHICFYPQLIVCRPTES